MNGTCSRCGKSDLPVAAGWGDGNNSICSDCSVIWRFLQARLRREFWGKKPEDEE